MKIKIAILGSTGSIGKSTIKIIKDNPKNFNVVLLTANNNYKELAKQAKELKAKDLIINNPKILEDVFEALVGALYLDLGMIHAREFILRIINDPQVIDFRSLLIDTNYKDVITRHCQAQKWEPPQYVATQETDGTQKWFLVKLIIRGKQCGHGTGKSKREAEQASSLVALNTLKIPTQFIM